MDLHYESRHGRDFRCDLATNTGFIHHDEPLHTARTFAVIPSKTLILSIGGYPVLFVTTEDAMDASQQQ